MYLIDTHAHLDFKEYDKDREQVIKRAFADNVEKIINVGCNIERSEASIELAKDYDQVYASVGIHPHDAVKYQYPKACKELYQMGKKNKVIAIGEIGLDYYRLEKESDKELQIKCFRQQLDIAKQLELPVILHCRDAYEEMLSILKADDIKNGVTHCFLGNREIAKQFLDLGFSISFTGAITFAKKEEVLKAVYEIPLGRILIETDCPYLTPMPHRGERNEPAYVSYVAEKITTIKEIGFNKVAEQTTKNAEELFKV